MTLLWQVEGLIDLVVWNSIFKMRFFFVIYADSGGVNALYIAMEVPPH